MTLRRCAATCCARAPKGTVRLKMDVSEFHGGKRIPAGANAVEECCGRAPQCKNITGRHTACVVSTKNPYDSAQFVSKQQVFLGKLPTDKLV